MGNKKEYTYLYRLRGFSLGCQPNDFISHNDNIGKWGTVTYNRPLTDKELLEYDLQPMTDNNNNRYQIIINDNNNGSNFDIKLLKNGKEIFKREKLSDNMTENIFNTMIKHFNIPYETRILFNTVYNGSINNYYYDSVKEWIGA